MKTAEFSRRLAVASLGNKPLERKAFNQAWDVANSKVVQEARAEALRANLMRLVGRTHG